MIQRQKKDRWIAKNIYIDNYIDRLIDKYRDEKIDRQIDRQIYSQTSTIFQKAQRARVPFRKKSTEGLERRPSIFKTEEIYRVFIKYCVFPEIFKYIPDSGLFRFPLGVSVCTPALQYCSTALTELRIITTSQHKEIKQRKRQKKKDTYKLIIFACKKIPAIIPCQGLDPPFM